ncbi:hypothetical protein IID19_03885, partial [Patescibacteria group bacterium]|nr:hypothetical protein [Patescibacteria group bacterium]
PPTQAQEEILPIDPQPDTDVEDIADANLLVPIIVSEDFIPDGKTALFDASESQLPAEGAATYRWDFTDLPLAQFGKEILHEFKTAGIHKVTLTITQGPNTAATSKEVFVYDKKILMITDRNVSEDFQLIVDQAANSGVFLKVISAVEEETVFLNEESLVLIIGDEDEFIKEADSLIFYTKSSLGLQAFTRFWQNLDGADIINLQKKLLVRITDQNMAIAAELAQQSFKVIQPRFILLTRKEALNTIFEIDDPSQLITTLENRVIEFRIIDARSEKSKLFFLSHAVTNFIAKGIPTNTIYIILAFPFIAFIITFIRQVIGISAFGIYTPLMITLSLLILGIYFGLGAIIVIVTVSYVLRKALNRFKLMYIPKTSLILSAIGLSFLAVLWFLSYYRVSLAVSLAIFPMLVMSTISEKFLSAQSEEGFRGALLGVFKTIMIAIAAYYVVIWAAFSDLIMSWPELIIVPLLGIILLGKFTGLRLTEYARFRSLFREKNIEE